MISLSYYGGAKGQVLQISQNEDGSVKNTVIHKDEGKGSSGSTFDVNLQNIQEAAAKLVAIQHMAQKRGVLSPQDNLVYADNLHQLGVAAQELAKLQREGDQHDFRKLFEGYTRPIFGSNQKMDGSQFDEENVGEEEEQTDDDTVQVNVPKEESAVAEVKPVGLAIAGIGGVASSKPMGTAVSGKDGLAVAQPVATAIAGLTPAEVSSLGISLPNKVRAEALKKLVASSAKEKYSLRADGVLAGPADDTVVIDRIDAFLGKTVVDNSQKKAHRPQENPLAQQQPTGFRNVPLPNRAQFSPATNANNYVNVGPMPDFALRNYQLFNNIPQLQLPYGNFRAQPVDGRYQNQQVVPQAQLIYI